MDPDDDYDPRKPPNSPHAWQRLHEGAEKGAMAWAILEPFADIRKNWKTYSAVAAIAAGILAVLRPDWAQAVAVFVGWGKP